MIECLGNRKNFNRKSVYRALGVIGHFYGDMDKQKVVKFKLPWKYLRCLSIPTKIWTFQAISLLEEADLDNNGKWEDFEVGYLQQKFYNQFIKDSNNLETPVQLWKSA